MRSILVCITCLIFLSCGESGHSHTDNKNDSLSSVKNQELKKIRWIEGNWKGMYQGKPFFEEYEFINDTTLRITSYEWNGKDSSKTSLSYVYRSNGDYYLGDSMNYKVTSVSDTAIHMDPNYKAGNDITWTFKDANTWLAVLKARNGTNTYTMERMPALESLLKKSK